MTEMTTHERMKRMYEHREADRVPITDSPWETTVKRWNREGMPENTNWIDYFDVDKIYSFSVDTSPHYERKIIEETDRYVIYTTDWGATIKSFKNATSTSECLDFKLKTAEAWEEAFSRMTTEDERIPIEKLKKLYPKWRAEGAWVFGTFWFGFDVTHSRMMGTEDTLVAMLEEPEFMRHIFDCQLERNIKMFERAWELGFRLDEAFWYDDMGYKGTPFFSPQIYRDVLKPYHKKLVDWAHNHGIVARLHSCGNIMPLLPDVVDTGVDALNPLEVKAGMDPIKLKKEYGDKLVLHGGINALSWNDADVILDEIKQKLPILKENGGYIFSTDHSIPDNVSLETMTKVINEVKELTKY